MNADVLAARAKKTASDKGTPSSSLKDLAPSPTRFPLLLTKPSSIEAEAIRALRTRIVAQHVQQGRRSLAICSPAEESGSTFVATNLAVALSQIGIKTALVDADLRAPSVDQAFGLPEGRKGLSEYLADPTVEIDDVLLDDMLPDLSILPAGKAPDNPQELLSGARFPELVNQLLREYEITIFDTTPSNRCTDALRVANIASYCLLVGRKHKSFVSDVKTLSKLLKADRSVVVGTVLNDF